MTDTQTRPTRFATRLVHRPRIPGEPAAASSTPIYQTATFRVDDQQQWDYSRSGNPTRAVLEEQLARLDDAERALAYASGMAAIAATLRLVPSGGRLVVGIDLYGGTLRLLDDLARERDLEVVFTDSGDSTTLARTLDRPTSMVWIETPSNPRLRVCDLEEAARLAHRAGALLAVDNSMLSPLTLRPLALGADLAVQSATKILGGHSDLSGGVVTTRDRALGERLAFLQNAEGTALGPFDSWLLLRGIETLDVRARRQLANTTELIGVLRRSPVVTALYTAPDCPVASFDTGSLPRSRAILQALRLFRPTVSFGGVTSSVSLPSAMSHASVPERWRDQQALSPSLVRLAVGIEDPRDLSADLEAALEVAARADQGRRAAASGSVEIRSGVAFCQPPPNAL